MRQTKEEFIKSFLPDEVETVELTQINMDITDLGLADILRNLNKLYPYNTRSRNAIISGKMIIGVLCKTETLGPLSGLFVIIGADNVLEKFELISTNYLVLCISEKTMRNDESIDTAIYNFTAYLATNYRDTIYNISDLYRKFIYSPTEDDFDNYEPESY